MDCSRFSSADQDFLYKGVDAKGKPLKPIAYKDLDLNLPWESFDLAHELTTKGIQKVVADYPEHRETVGIVVSGLSWLSLFATTN